MRPLHTPICVLAAGATLSLATSASAFTWTETIDGDLSGDRLAPSAFVASAGANVLSMTSGSASGSTDRDYFTVTVPGGLQLSSIRLLAAEVDGAVSFIGVQAGSVFTEPAIGASVANLLGWHHFAGAEAGTDILDDIASGAGSIGFTPPLASGAYTFWAQDFGFEASYSMEFNLTPIPEPGAVTLLAGGIAMLAHWRGSRGSAR